MKGARGSAWVRKMGRRWDEMCGGDNGSVVEKR